MLETCARPSRVVPAPLVPELPPGVARLLLERGVPARPGPAETEDRWRARLETALMAAFRERGDEPAFEALYVWTRPTVERTVAARLRGTSRSLDLNELVQDVFVNLYRYAASFRDERAASFRCWMSTIATNVVRRQMSARLRLSLQDLPESAQEPADRRDGPHQGVAGEEERAALKRAWLLLLQYYARAYAELSPRDRLALELVEVEELTYAQACARLRVGMSNMKMIMFRARRRLRNHMQRAMGGGPVEVVRLAG